MRLRLEQNSQLQMQPAQGVAVLLVHRSAADGRRRLSQGPLPSTEQNLRRQNSGAYAGTLLGDRKQEGRLCTNG